MDTSFNCEPNLVIADKLRRREEEIEFQRFKPEDLAISSQLLVMMEQIINLDPLDETGETLTKEIHMANKERCMVTVSCDDITETVKVYPYANTYRDKLISHSRSIRFFFSNKTVCIDHENKELTLSFRGINPNLKSDEEIWKPSEGAAKAFEWMMKTKHGWEHVKVII